MAKVENIIRALIQKEFNSDDVLTEVKPGDVISILSSVLTELDCCNFEYELNENSGHIYFYFKGFNSKISVSNLSSNKSWKVWEKSDHLLISVSFPIFKVDANKKIMDFNSKNPNVKFYKVGRKVFIEEAYYLSHGVKVLNVLDRLVEYLHIIKSINQKTKETNNE